MRILGYHPVEAWWVAGWHFKCGCVNVLNFLERTIIVSEYVGESLSEKSFNNVDDILRIFYQVARGLAYIHENGFAVQNLEPKNILVDELNNAKLYNYGLFCQTNGGEYITFPIG